MAAEHKDIEIRIKVTASMYSKIHHVVLAEEITQSEYLRTLIREDMKRREQALLSLALARSEAER